MPEPARYRSVLTLGYRIDPKLTTELLVGTIAAHLCFALRALWFKLLVDAVVAGDLTGTTVIAVVLAVSDALRSTCQVRSRLAGMDLGDKATQHFQEETMRLAVAPAGIAHHERQDYADRLDEYKASAPVLASGLETVTNGVALALRATFTLALLVWVHPLLVLLPLFAVPALWSGRRGQAAIQDGQARSAALNRRLEHLYSILTTPHAAKEVRIFRLGPELRRRDERLWRQVTTIQSRAQIRSHLTAAAGWLVFAAGFLSAILLVVREAAAGRANGGDLLLTVVLASQVNLVVQESASLMATLSSLGHTLDLRRWLIGFVSEPDGRSTPAPSKLHEGITFVDVSFGYEGAERPAIRHLNLHIPAGSTIAVVGENGAGKTTLVKLLCAFYDPDEGRILVDGVDLATIEPGTWRAHIAAGFQDFARFELLARQTVGVGDLPRIDDATAVRDALDRAAARPVVDGLEGGLEAQLGTQFDGGVELSGGEWQRLAVSRAMMRPSPLLLLLDEPTSAIDSTTEFALFERYAAAARVAASHGAITVLVSHRLSTVRLADLIMVLADGALVEMGTHEELMGRQGMYREIYELQAASYR